MINFVLVPEQKKKYHNFDLFQYFEIFNRNKHINMRRDVSKGKIYLSAVLEVSFLFIVFGILKELKNKPFKKTMFLSM